jgi:hypothetical protein
MQYANTKKILEELVESMIGITNNQDGCMHRVMKDFCKQCANEWLASP